jgi:predicted dinucleotide-binding enzyme
MRRGTLGNGLIAEALAGVPICGADGVEVVAELVQDLGCVPVAAGGLVRAKLLEATAALAIAAALVFTLG